jgi:hypothetical protein
MRGDLFMTHLVTLRLTDQEYQTLVAEATRRGKQPDALLHDMIERLRLSSQEKRPMTGRELAEKLYREGKLANLATQRPLTREEQEEREQLIQRLGGGKPASEMVIEDRGPY